MSDQRQRRQGVVSARKWASDHETQSSRTAFKVPNGVKLFVDPVSISYLKGAEVDFVDTVTGGGFTIKNPNAVSTCGCGSSFSV